MSLQEFVNNRLEEFRLVIESFPWESKQAYESWVAQTYFFARETTTLLSLAAAKSVRNSKTQLRFIAHASEEKGHEKLLEMDLKGLGSSIAAHKEFSSTCALYQSQYYWLYQAQPETFFGYILFLEGIGAVYGAEIHHRSKAAHGAGSTFFAKVHSEDDVDHIEKALQEIASFDQPSLELITRNFEVTAQFYKSMLEGCVFNAADSRRAA
ncbi:MAG: hypothetical protein EOP06_00305 [Proteobacteria bacterium]|nr:MAG: hypothetical protein EOP06_00305 [Pseudomonadota bacterium]